MCRRGQLPQLSLFFYIVGMLGLYSLSFGKALGMMLYQVRWCLPRWMMVGCVLMLPFYATCRRLGAWTSLIWLNILTLVATICIPLSLIAKDGVNVTRPADALMVSVVDLKFDGVLIGLCMMTFAFAS